MINLLLGDLVAEWGLDREQEKSRKNHARLHPEQDSLSLIHAETTVH